jgi:CRISPR/Cas system CSM-associated protein Csm4 (group 5 of RAMP superfamily)
MNKKKKDEKKENFVDKDELEKFVKQKELQNNILKKLIKEIDNKKSQ